MTTTRWLLTLVAAFLLGCGDGDTSNLPVGAHCLDSAQCAKGLECEREHDAGFCQTHGGDDSGGGGGTDNHDNSGPGKGAGPAASGATGGGRGGR